MSLHLPFLRCIAVRLICMLSVLLCTSCEGSSFTNTQATAPSPTVPATKQLGTFYRVSGTSYLRAPISQEARREGGFLSSSAVYTPQRAHNLVFLNEQNDAVHQLLPDNTSVILSDTALPEQGTTDRANWTVSWFLYALVKQDTNGDGELSEDDQQTIAISDAGGEGYTEVIEDVEATYGQALPDLQTLVVIYRKAGKTYVSRINLPQRTVLRTTELPSFGPDVR